MMLILIIKLAPPTLPDHVRSSSGVYEIRLVQSLVSYVVFCRSLLVLLAIVLSILPQVTAFDYLIGIFELFLVLATSRFRTRASQI